MKIITAQLDKFYNNFKKLRQKLLKTNAAIWFNKICRAKGLQPKYISIHTKGRFTRDTRTTSQAIKCRNKQEIKFLYKRKQHFNQQLYRMHLEGSTMFEGMRPHASSNIEAGISIIMELQYKILHDKIEILEERSKLKRGTSEQHDTPTTGVTRIINLIKKQLTIEQINILNLGPQYAMEINPK